MIKDTTILIWARIHTRTGNKKTSNLAVRGNLINLPPKIRFIYLKLTIG